MTATDSAVDIDDDDYEDTGLYYFIGPLAELPDLDGDAPEPSPAEHAHHLEYIRRRDWAANVLWCAEHEAERDRRQAEFRAMRDAWMTRQANEDRIEAADLRWRADRDLQRAKALDELRESKVELSDDDAEFLKARHSNRLDVIATKLGLASTMDLRRAAPAAANDNKKGGTVYPGIVSSADFVRGFVPPDYHLDGIAQAGFLYALTAGTGTGKTAVLLALTASTAMGTTLCGRAVRKGRVVYFAGENPDDVRMRWLAMAHHMGFDPADMDVHFIAGTFSIPAAVARIGLDVERLGGADMIVVDTSAAYFQGEDENGNTALGKHARDLRALTELPGKPAVFVACHPTKNADPANLQPRGGGAFIAEVDGNLTLTKDNGLAKLHWQVKHRGADFQPLFFALETVTAPRLVDSMGRPVPTVMASGMADWVPPVGRPNKHDEAVLESLRGARRWGGTVDLKAWRRAYYDDHIGEEENVLKSRFNRARANLRTAGLVIEAEGEFTLSDEGTK